MTNTLQARLSPEDAKAIDDNLINLSRSLGYKINVSKLLRHVMINMVSKHSLYSIGYISFQELNSSATFKRGGKDIKILRRLRRK